MREAQLIVLVLGNTDGLRWELRQCVERGYVNKIVLVVPDRPIGLSKYVYATNINGILSEAFSGTKWVKAIDAVDLGDAAVISMTSGGKVFVCRSSERTARDFFVSIRLSIFRLLKIKNRTNALSAAESISWPAGVLHSTR